MCFRNIWLLQRMISFLVEPCHLLHNFILPLHWRRLFGRLERLRKHSIPGIWFGFSIWLFIWNLAWILDFDFFIWNLSLICTFVVTAPVLPFADQCSSGSSFSWKSHSHPRPKPEVVVRRNKKRKEGRTCSKSCWWNFPVMLLPWVQAASNSFAVIPMSSM